MRRTRKVEAEVALDTAIAALHAVSNLTAILADIAIASGAPVEAVRMALAQLDEAHDAVISQQESKMLLSNSLAAIRRRVDSSIR